MSRLLSTSSPEKRVRHTLKHFFNLAERFWELTGDFPSWRERWNALRIADALDPDRPERVETNQAAAQAARTGHDEWFALAVQARTHAEGKQQVFLIDANGKHLFIGPAGLIVFARRQGRDYVLLTSFRCTPSWSRRGRAQAGSPQPWEEAAWHRAETGSSIPVQVRAAVRRAHRRALFDRSEEAASPVPSPAFPKESAP